MRDNEATTTIIRRRARFVGAALAAAGLSAGSHDARAQDAGDGGDDAALDAATAEPEVCLCTCRAAGTKAPSPHAALLLPLAAAAARRRRSPKKEEP